MTSLGELYAAMNSLDIRLSADGGKLVIDAPAGVLTPEITAALVQHKVARVSTIADDRPDPVVLAQIAAIDWNAPPLSEQIEAGRRHNESVRKRR